MKVLSSIVTWFMGTGSCIFFASSSSLRSSRFLLFYDRDIKYQVPHRYPKPVLRMRSRIILGSYLYPDPHQGGKPDLHLSQEADPDPPQSRNSGAVEVQNGASGHRFTSLRSRIPIRVKEKSWMRIHQHQSEKANSDSHQGDADPQES